MAVAELVALTREQRRIVEYGEGPLVVIAGAGTGKTRVIIERVRWLLETKGEGTLDALGRQLPAEPASTAEPTHIDETESRRRRTHATTEPGTLGLASADAARRACAARSDTARQGSPLRHAARPRTDPRPDLQRQGGQGAPDPPRRGRRPRDALADDRRELPQLL